MSRMPDLACNPAVSHVTMNHSYSYPFGNTKASDLTEGCRLGTDVRFLLLGCGDIRNIIYTVNEISTLEEDPKHLHFHLNDTDTLVLARNVLLLQIVKNVNLSIADDIEFLFSVWYNVHLAKAQSQRLKMLLRDLLQNPFENMQFASAGCEDKLKKVFKFWLKCPVKVETMMKEREKFFKSEIADWFHEKYEPDLEMAVYQTLQKEATIVPRSVNSTTYKNWRDEIKYYYKFHSSLSTPMPSKDQLTQNYEPNVTFWCPDFNGWRVHSAATPFHSFDLMTFDEKRSLRDNCLALLKEHVTAWHSYHSKGGVVEISIWHGDGLTLCNYHLPRDLKFDFINASNIADSCGLLNTVLSCEPLLKCDGILNTQTLLWSNKFKAIEEYLFSQLEMKPELYSRMIGLHLAEDFELGTSKLAAAESSGHHIAIDEVALRWVPATLSDSDKIQLNESQDVLVCFRSIAKKCLTSFPYDLDKLVISTCDTLKTTGTLVLLIRSMADRVVGDASSLVKIASECLSKEHITRGFAPGRRTCLPLKAEWDLMVQLHFKEVMDKKDVTSDHPVEVHLQLPGFDTTTEMTALESMGSYGRNFVKMKRGNAPVGAHFVMRACIHQSYEEAMAFTVGQCQSSYHTFTCVDYNFKENTIIVLMPRRVYEEATIYTVLAPFLHVLHPAPLSLGTCFKERTKLLPVQEAHLKKISEVTFNTLSDKEPTTMEMVYARKSGDKKECKQTEQGKSGLLLVPYRTVSLQPANKVQIDETKMLLYTCAMTFPNKLFKHGSGASKQKPMQPYGLPNVLHTILTKAMENEMKFKGEMKELNVYGIRLKNSPHKDTPVADLSNYTGEEIMVRVKTFCLMNGKPAVTVQWIDFQAYRDRTESGEISEPDVVEYVQYHIQQQGFTQCYGMEVTKKVAMQLKTLLKVNTLRTKQLQANAEVVFYSFLQPMYRIYSRVKEEQNNRSQQGSARNLGAPMSHANIPVRSPGGASGVSVETDGSNATIKSTETCAACGRKSDDLRKCTRCKAAFYCNTNCQRRDWPKHKQLCKNIK